MAKKREFHIFTDPATDADVLLPTLNDMDEQEFFWNKQREEAEARLERVSENDRAVVEQEITHVQLMLERLKGMRASRDKILPAATLYRYEIIKPTWLRYDEALAASESLDIATGIITRNQITIRKELFGEMVKVWRVTKKEGTEEEEVVENVPYQAVIWLWEKAVAAMEVNPARLDFLLRRYGSGSNS